jgi:hypothetical protein
MKKLHEQNYVKKLEKMQMASVLTFFPDFFGGEGVTRAFFG